MALRIFTIGARLAAAITTALATDPAAAVAPWPAPSYALALNSTSGGSTPANAVYNVTNGAIAVGTWIRINDTSKRNAIAICHNTTDSNNNKFLFEVNLNRLSLYSYSTFQFYSPSFPLSVGVDYFVCFRYDYSLSGNNLFLYIAQVGDTNLTLLGSYNLTSPLPSTTANTIIDIGFFFSDGGVVSNCTIDGWWCDTTGITVAQIEADMYRQTTYLKPRTTGYNFNQLAGVTTVTDVSGNGRHATIKATSQRLAQTVPFTA